MKRGISGAQVLPLILTTTAVIKPIKKGTHMNSGADSISQIKATLIDLAIRFGPKVLTAILILVAGVFVANWCARAVARGLHRFELEPPLRNLLTRLVRVLLVGVFLIMALQNLGVELLPLIAGLGVAGAGIALATQGVLSNVVAGLTIIFTKPYRVGEYIAVAGVEGAVAAITLFSTVLTHPDRSQIVVPNRKVVGEILQNFGRIRQSEVLVGIAYDSDLASALDAIRDVVSHNPRVLADPKPVVQINLLADSAVQIAIRPWVGVTDYSAISGEINLSVAEDLRNRGIVMPVPQREVRLLKDAA
jgi:small conductance mechanosensitive channel